MTKKHFETKALCGQILTSEKSYASISKKSYSSPGWTYIPSIIAFNPGGFTQSFSTGSFYFQLDEVEVFY
ncbi:hypothetical protein pdam_00015687 [Pocillopora damicornis]|uniref:Uncharacterized protein n=1 Tax=Pocillopora damicornis TaxID=46731 RepID=A0A3M6TZ85_POCDA|nr:hypothetical protein pdam_00015687 [Pocillopora damicornis]